MCCQSLYLYNSFEFFFVHFSSGYKWFYLELKRFTTGFPTFVTQYQ